MKPSFAAALAMAPIAALLSACTTSEAPPETLRAVRTAEVRYADGTETNRYVGTVRARYEVDQAFRVAGKVVQRRFDVGDSVREGDLLAVLDDADYRLAVEAAQQQWIASTAQARQAESDRKRLDALKLDGSVSPADDERAQSTAAAAKAAAEADAKKLELARNRLKYTALHASRSGTVTALKLEVGQVVAEGQAVVSIASQGEPEIVVDVPEDHVAAFRAARYKASLASAPDEVFDVVLREMSTQAVDQTRTFRARLRPAKPRRLPLGATATLVVERPRGQASAAAVPAGAITQDNGRPALWIVRRQGGEATGTVELTHVAVHGYRNDDVLVSGPPAGELVVAAGVQKMAPGLRVALPGDAAPPAVVGRAAP